MQDPNAVGRQVGGTHYLSTYQHWDMCLDLNLGYLDGVATKYITRWRKAKKPAEDLLKALHYVEKMISTKGGCFPRLRAPHRTCVAYLQEFIEANDLVPEDAALILALVTWETGGDLQSAVKQIKHLLKECDLPVAKMVPLEDSNKHAERA